MDLRRVILWARFRRWVYLLTRGMWRGEVAVQKFERIAGQTVLTQLVTIKLTRDSFIVTRTFYSRHNP